MSVLYRTVLYLFAFLPRPIRPRSTTTSMGVGFRSTIGRRMLMPRDTAARFKREFEEEYGSSELPFFEGGIAQAQDMAKRDLKFLLVVLMSPEHDDTESFIRETLLSDEVVGFINDPTNNIVLWGGNVLDSEAYQVSLEYNCTKYPFSALVCLTPKEGSTRMSIVRRIAGPKLPAAYINELQTAINRYSPDLAGVRAERTSHDFARSIRTEQDSAYERSLARDRERAKQKREAEAAALEAVKKAVAASEQAAILRGKQRQWRRWRAAELAPEPAAGAKDVVRLALKMPESTGAGRIVRRFSAGTTLEELYAFIECHDVLNSATKAGEADKTPTKPEDYVHEYRFRVVSLMPRVIYEPSENDTIGQQIGKSGNLIVEEMLADDEDEE